LRPRRIGETDIGKGDLAAGGCGSATACRSDDRRPHAEDPNSRSAAPEACETSPTPRRAGPTRSRRTPHRAKLGKPAGADAAGEDVLCADQSTTTTLANTRKMRCVRIARALWTRERLEGALDAAAKRLRASFSCEGCSTRTRRATRCIGGGVASVSWAARERAHRTAKPNSGSTMTGMAASEEGEPRARHHHHGSHDEQHQVAQRDETDEPTAP